MFRLVIHFSVLAFLISMVACTSREEGGTTGLFAPPQEPTGATVTANSDTQLTLDWSSGGGTTADYLISYTTGATAPSDCESGTVVPSSSVTGTQHVITLLDPDTQYAFRVCAVNGNPVPDMTSGTTATGTTLESPPNQPSGLVVTVDSSTQISLTWTSGGGFTSGYRIAYQTGLVAPASCALGTVVTEGSIVGTTHAVTPLSADTNYAFRVCAINGNPTADVSSGITGTGRTLQAVPNNPTNLIVTVDSSTQITLSWTSGGGSTAGYRIAYQLGTTAPATCALGTVVAEGSIVGTAHVFTPLAEDTDYAFRVCAINSNPTPDVSSGVTGTNGTLQVPPNDPSGLTVAIDSATAMTLSWTSGGGSTTGFRIAYQRGATAPASCELGTVINEGSITGTSHQVTPLTNGYQYAFRVCAVNSNPSPDLSAGITGVETAWWNGDWAKRRSMTFDNSTRAEDLDNFQVLVVLTNGVNINYAQTQNAGEDIRFVDADSNTELDYQIENWNEAGSSYVWVKIPRINASSASDYIWMYYGNNAAFDGSQPTLTWDGSYQGVWHFNEDPSMDAVVDSTSNANDAGIQGNVATDTLFPKFGNALTFDGAGDLVRVPQSAVLDIATGYTIEGWFRLNANFTSATVTTQTLLAKHISNNDDSVISLVGTNFNRPSAPEGAMVFKVEQNGSIIYKYTDASHRSWTADTWYYFAIVGDSDDAENNRIYINGVNATDAVDELSGNPAIDWALSADVTFGGGEHDTGQIAAGTAYLNGRMDEMRIADTARSANWVSAQYASMQDTLIAYGDEVAGP